MNHDQPHTASDAAHSDLHDRLMDASLRELLGGQQPPDMTSRILAAAAAPAAEAAAVADENLRVRAPVPPQAPSRWRSLAIAAGLLIAVAGGAVLLLPSWEKPREAAQHTLQGEVQAPSSSVKRVGTASENLDSQEGDVSVQASTAGGVAPAETKLSPARQAQRVRPFRYTEEAQLQRGSQQPGKGPALDAPPLVPAPNDSGINAQSPLGTRPGASQVGPGQNGRQSGGLGNGKKHRDADRSRYADQKPDPTATSATKPQDDKSGGKESGDRANKQQPSQPGRDYQLKEFTERGQRANTVAELQRREANLRNIRGDQLARNDGRWGRHENLDDGDGQRFQSNPNEAAQSLDPSEGGNRFRRIVENAYLDSLTHPLSTFSIDVDTASYANVRQFIMQQGVLPPPNAVRIEELINYFRYDYARPKDGRPFASHIEVADCPWAQKHKLVRVAIKGRDVAPDKRPQANLVFLIDVSGSMDGPKRLPLVIRSLKLLTEQLRNTDRVAIVVYAGSSGLVLPSTLGESRETILTALDNLRAGGSTNGGAGIELAYRVAKENYIAGGINRVVLCTDGDFNVGITSDMSLERLIEEKAKEGTFLTVLGYGCGNFNDSMLETISGKGNGNYAYVDNIDEARKVLVEQLSGTLMTIAKDVKIQIEFNPAKVAGYRLLGYEDRILAAEDFNNDKKDAGEIGSGHTVTALYEIVPAGERMPAAQVDELKYQKPKKVAVHDEADELLTLKIRYKEPTADVSQLIEVAVGDEGKRFAAASSDFQFAAAVAGFGMLLRDSQHKGTLTYDAVLEIAAQHKGEDLSGYRKELLELIRKAQQIAK